jgi:hypothetical protein
MPVQMIFPQSVKATVNFAADRNDGGQFSNTNPSTTRQNLLPVEIEITNVRKMARQPSLETLGFTYVAHPAGKADWANSTWIESEYVPSCLALIKNLTGAKTVVPLFIPLQRRTDYGKHQGTAPTAGFVHLDLPRDAYTAAATMAADAHGVKFKRGAVYNIWKAITPPPQSQPLAVCDWRSVSEDDHVIGLTAEGEVNVPYVTLAHSEKAPKWYYVPDIGLDESLVFVGGDLDPSHPLGCAHTAFVHPAPNDGAPRASLEARVLACFE